MHNSFAKWKNRKAAYNFEILEEKEAGIALTGIELRSIRLNGLNISNAFASFSKQELWLHNLTTSEIKERSKKLLLHKKELLKLYTISKKPGIALIVTEAYFAPYKYRKAQTPSLLKIKLAIGKGVGKKDRREQEKAKEHKREAQLI